MNRKLFQWVIPFFICLIVCTCSLSSLWGQSFDPKAISKAARMIFPGYNEIRVRFILETELYAKGFTYRNFEALSQGISLGFFTQIVVRGRGRDLINGVFRLSNGKIVNSAAVKPLVFHSDNNDVQNFDIARLIAHFRSTRVQRYGASMSTFFNGLRYLPSIHSGALARQQKEEMLQEPKWPMTVSAPSPVIGSSCPHFSVQSLEGGRISPHTFANRPFVIFMASYRNAMSVEMARALYDLLPPHEDKIGFVEVYEDPRWFILEQLRKGAVFKGRVGCDSQNKTAKILSVPYAPYVLCYDKEHRLQAALPFKGRITARKKLNAFISSSIQ